MQTKWTSHLPTDQDKEKFKQAVLGSKHALDRLTAILEEEEAGLDRSETNIKVFDLPNWENRQAFKNGYRSCLAVIKNLINLDQQKDVQT